MNSSKNTIAVVLNTENRGARVLATLFDGSVVERFVWEEDREEGVVYLCTAEVFSILSRGDKGARPLGFPADSVKWEQEETA